MISSVAWLPRGAARPVPVLVEPSEEELAALRARAESLEADAADDEDEAEEEGEEDDEASDSASDSEPAATAAAATARRHAANLAADPGLDAALAELHMERYDEEDEAGAARLFGGSGPSMVHASNEDDPYITLHEEDDDDEVEDFTLRDTDLVLLAARTEDDVSHLEVWVYEEAGEDGEANLYVHHDQLLPAFPLSLAWLDCPPGASGGESRGSFVAVGTMETSIEIWDLDVLDAVEPALVLGAPPPAPPAPAARRGKKGRTARGVNPAAHTDAVMGLAWNPGFRNVLASSSADGSVKVWDVATGACEHTLRHHSSKVQALAWCPASAPVLLTGAYDRTAAVVDARAPAAVARFALPGDCEALCWVAGSAGGHSFAVTSDTGSLTAWDTRQPAAPLFECAAHPKAACGVASCSAAPGLMATCGLDKTTALWDTRGAAPSLLARKDLRVGAAFCAAFAASAPSLLAVAGGRGTVTVWDVAEDEAVGAAFPALRKAGGERNATMV